MNVKQVCELLLEEEAPTRACSEHLDFQEESVLGEEVELHEQHVS